MTRRAGWLGFGVVLVLASVAACRFEPDLTRFAPCAEGGGCPSGTTCLAEAQRCLPDCGAQGPCVPEEPEEPSPDAATEADGGSDAGTDAGAEDAGPTRPLLRFAGPGVLANAYDAQNYTEQVSALGGTPPYHFSLADGGLPPGLSLQDGGQVVGKPSGTREVGFLVQVTDSDTPPQTVVGSASLSVLSPPSDLTVATQSVPDGRVGQPYRYVLRAAGVVGTLTWRFFQGAPPPGLQFSSDGVISGTPTEARPTGGYTFIMEVEDEDLLSTTTAYRSLTLTVHPAD